MKASETEKVFECDVVFSGVSYFICVLCEISSFSAVCFSEAAYTRVNVDQSCNLSISCQLLN